MGDETTYRLKLVEGDDVKTTVTEIDRNGAKVDTTSWSNVETARIVNAQQNTAVVPDSEVYATVTAVESGEATLKQKRGVYRRNHLPGDRLRVQGCDRVSSSLVRSEPDEFRNLCSIENGRGQRDHSVTSMRR